jgi:hypothetical protein
MATLKEEEVVEKQEMKKVVKCVGEYVCLNARLCLDQNFLRRKRRNVCLCVCEGESVCLYVCVIE